MTDRRNEGLWAWRQSENHNHMIALQESTLPPARDGAVELAFFGGSAFRVTTPAGLTLMIDPWRNPPWGNWDWYHYDFPAETVDIAVSTHAHFDHDGLHALSANVIIDRLIGTYEFADLKITGIADKHVSDSRHNAYDWAEMTRRLTDVRTDPEDNWRSFDNCLLLVETGGLKILHWGDNRPNPPESVWERLGEVDIALLPVDGSQHVMSYAQVEAVAERLKPHLVVPHHYGIWDLTMRASTLLPADEWVNGRKGSIRTDSGTIRLDTTFVKGHDNVALSFGEHVAFDKAALLAKARER